MGGGAQRVVARAAASVLVALCALVGLVGLVGLASPAQAAPAAPVPLASERYVDYFESVRIQGTKELGTSIAVELLDGRSPACLHGSDPTDTFWYCDIDYTLLWPRPAGAPVPEPVRVYAVDALGARSLPASIDLTFEQSSFEILTDPKLSAGDVTVIEGTREVGTTIDWVITGPSGPVFSVPRQCTLPEEYESGVFTCVYDSSSPTGVPSGTPASTRSSRRAARLGRASVQRRVPDGSYTATIREFNAVPVLIDQVTFSFTVGSSAAPAGPAPGVPTAAATATPTAAPSSAGSPAPGSPSSTPTSAGPGGGGPGGPGSPGGPSGPEGPGDPGGPADPTTSPTIPGELPQTDPSTPQAPVEASDPPDVIASPGSTPPTADILRLLLLAVLVFTVMGLLGVPGLGVGGRFAPGSTRTGGGALPVGWWPAADTLAAGGAHRTSSAGPPGSTRPTGLAAGSVGAADAAVGTAAVVAEGWGDRSPTWRAPGHRVLDALARALPGRLAPRWPLLSRLVDDGTPLRAVLGSLSGVLTVVALALGAVAALSRDGLPLAPGLALAVLLLSVGLLDALAGAAAVLGYSSVVVLAGGLNADGLTLGQGLRGLIGVAALWFVVPLVAGAARPFRRVRSPGQVYAWDRLADAVIAALLSGWAVQGLVSSLGDLVGRSQPATAHADLLGLLTVALVGLRFGLEEVAARGYPRRLTEVHSDAAPAEPSSLVQLRGLVVRAGFLAFFAWAFLGSCWQLWLGVTVFALPYALALVHRVVPDLRPVSLTVPRGVVQVLVLVLVGAALAYWLDDRSAADPTGALRNGFVLLAVPASAIGVLAVVGGEPPAQRWTWPRQLTGAVVVAVTVVAVLVWL